MTADAREGYNLIEVLEAIDPHELGGYDDWLRVAQGLHHEGYGYEVFGDWLRVHGVAFDERMTRQKWQSFGNYVGAPVTGGTIVQMARERGWTPPHRDRSHRALAWDAVIGGKREEPAIVDAASVGDYDEDVRPLYNAGHGAMELKAYIEALFEPGEVVGYVTDYAEKARDGEVKLIPGSRGVYTRTAGEICRKLDGGRIDAAVGTVHDESGAWIRFNPLDGEGVGNANVTAYRYALLESDDMPQGKFAAIVKQMNLPVAALVDSGGKSLHAIVRIDAADAKQYRDRVELLYARCERNGIAVDKANKNASRLSRMPGVMRRGKRQFLAGLAQGAADWEEWDEWYANETDELPDVIPLDTMLGDNLPPLKPALIDGLLRIGHKMLVSGPSKAGKSFALIALCIAFAEGGSWFGMKCRQSRVMYVNLELDGDSCINRFNDTYNALRVEPVNAGKIDIWNLRGKSEPMVNLLPKMVRRAKKHGTEVVIIDPIYKVMVGDENSAGDMAAFANLFDALCDQAGVSAIYCHHHSKGSQADKRSIDRASGSGVFGRDPDAILDMVELAVDEQMRWKHMQDAICDACREAVTAVAGREAWDALPDSVKLIEANAVQAAYKLLDAGDGLELSRKVEALKASKDALSAWRIEGTLREFPRFAPVNVWFEWPLHVVDDALDKMEEAGAENLRGQSGKQSGGKSSGGKTKKSTAEKKNDAIAEAVQSCAEDGVQPTRANVLERLQGNGFKKPSESTFDSWTRNKKESEWCEWRCVNENGLYLLRNTKKGGGMTPAI